MNIKIFAALAIAVPALLGAWPVAASSPAKAQAAPAIAVPADPLFTQPYVDIDEWRDAPMRHRYVHGGFKGTDTRFSFYFPPKPQYQGRFFQHFTPAPDNENLAQRVAPGEQNKIGLAITSGAYFVETNGGGAAVAGFGSKEPTLGAYRANAAAGAARREPHRVPRDHRGNAGAGRTAAVLTLAARGALAP